MKRGLSAILLLSFWLAVGAADAAMILQSYDETKHDLFYVGEDKAFIGEAYDWSGVGRSDRWATMVSSSYFISATHYHPANNTTIYFYYSDDPNGGYETRTVQSGVQIAGTDLWLGKLSEAVSDNVTVYSVLSLPELTDYDNRELYVFGRSDTSPTQTNVRLGRNNIDPDSYGEYTVDETIGNAYIFDYDNPGGLGDDECFLQAYDSGAPSFTIIDGAPALVGIHWFIGEDEETGQESSGDTFVSMYIDEINAAMSGEQLTVVPEPSSWALLLAAAAACMCRVRKRRL